MSAELQEKVQGNYGRSFELDLDEEATGLYPTKPPLESPDNESECKPKIEEQENAHGNVSSTPRDHGFSVQAYMDPTGQVMPVNMQQHMTPQAYVVGHAGDPMYALNRQQAVAAQACFSFSSYL